MSSSSWRRPGAVVLVVLVVIALAAGVWWLRSGSNDAPKYRFGRIEQGSMTALVAATGTLNPVTSVQVGTQVSGQIKELFVDFNSPVKKGQLVARIDPETFEYRVRQSQADADAARSALNRTQVNLANAKRELERSKELVARNFVSPADLDRAQATFDLAQADVKNAQAIVSQREASLASARVDLGRTEIRAPVDGVVIKRSVDVGQTVAASLQAPELFVIARDLRDMQVETSIDEADVGRVRLGQRATFTVDAFPGRTFAGEVKQVRKSAQNVQNVVTYTVLVTAVNEGGQLMPGMTANVRIVTDAREQVLKVPNAALRFRPSGEAAASAGAGSNNAGAGSANAAGRANGAAGAASAAERAGGAAQVQQFRQRLVTELKLDAEQQAKLDPIFAQMRERLAASRDGPDENRAKAAGAARADMRARIEEILTAEQKPRYAELAAEMGGRGAAPDGSSARGRIWVLEDGKPKPIDVRLGLTDGTTTEVIGDTVAPGMEVIVGTQSTGAAPAAPKGGPPRMFF